MGYLQNYGIDYSGCFALVAKVVAVRIILSIVAHYKWYVHHLDMNNTILHGRLEDLYLFPSQGFSAPFGQVCKLNKSLYGLKQELRQWYKKLSVKLATFGLFRSNYDHCLFLWNSTSTFIALIACAYYTLIIGTDSHKIHKIN